MNSDASHKFGHEENVFDTRNCSFKEESMQYIPNQKRQKKT